MNLLSKKSIAISIIAVVLFALQPAGADPIEKPEKLVKSARELSQEETEYDPDYARIGYPMGDVAADRGVCTDIVVRAFRTIGIDLQELVHKDMKANFHAYPAKRAYGQKKSDSNIDHRRVTNLAVFFKRNGVSLTRSIDSKDLHKWRPGDIVIFDLKQNGGTTHIGIISDRLDKASGRPLVFHHFPPLPSEDDALDMFAISGHYRYPVASDLIGKDQTSPPRGDNCINAPLASLNKWFTLDNSQARDDFSAQSKYLSPEHNGKGIPDLFRRIEIKKRSYLSVQAYTEDGNDLLLYLIKGCGDQQKVLFGGDFFGDVPVHPTLTVDPGTYYLVVDGKSTEQCGVSTLWVETESVAGFERLCRQAPLLRPGRKIQGKTSGFDRFDSGYGCDHSFDDALYRFKLKHKASVSIRAKSKRGVTVSLRDKCEHRAVPDSHVIMNSHANDEGDDQFLTTELEAGTYYAIVNGDDPKGRTPFTIEAMVDQK